jgi:hypothetical protein
MVPPLLLSVPPAPPAPPLLALPPELLVPPEPVVVPPLLPALGGFDAGPDWEQLPTSRQMLAVTPTMAARIIETSCEWC